MASSTDVSSTQSGNRSGFMAPGFPTLGLAAVAAVLLVAITRSGPTRSAMATVGDGELRVTPARPHPGDTLRVSYRPMPVLFRGERALLLRARLRTPLDGMYESSVPGRQLRVVATLRGREDGVYEGAFALPDSFVFVSLAVEDPGASHVDANGGRLWEVLFHEPDGRPFYEALEQRVNDMMGRSWEEGYATARRLGELYPERIGSWTLREFFESALLGEAGGESASAAYRSRIDSLVRAAKEHPALPYGDIGTIFFRAWGLSRRPGADSADLDYWWRRLRADYPRHEQVAQRLAVDLGQTYREHPRELLDTLERLYPQLVPIHGPGGSLFHAALRAANQLHDDVAYRRWLERSLSGAPDSASRMALALSARPGFRREGVTALRSLLATPSAHLLVTRALMETATEYGQRAEKLRRRMLAAVGRALVAEGQTRAGLDTLALAARDVWDLALFRDVAAAYLTAGDTSAAAEVHARLAVDPRTPAASADSMARAARASLGVAGWDSAIATARREMLARLLERALLRPLRGTARLQDASGRVHSLQELSNGQLAVVIFWSRHCGAAIQALPAIKDAVGRLQRGGSAVVFVVDEPPSHELTAYVAAQSITWPLYHDVGGATATAFANFGTPAYYVLDPESRIRFAHVDDEAELLAQVEALRSRAP